MSETAPNPTQLKQPGEIDNPLQPVELDLPADILDDVYDASEDAHPNGVTDWNLYGNTENVNDAESYGEQVDDNGDAFNDATANNDSTGTTDTEAAPKPTNPIEASKSRLSVRVANFIARKASGAAKNMEGRQTTSDVVSTKVGNAVMGSLSKAKLRKDARLKERAAKQSEKAYTKNYKIEQKAEHAQKIEDYTAIFDQAIDRDDARKQPYEEFFDQIKQDERTKQREARKASRAKTRAELGEKRRRYTKATAKGLGYAAVGTVLAPGAAVAVTSYGAFKGAEGLYKGSKITVKAVSEGASNVSVRRNTKQAEQLAARAEKYAAKATAKRNKAAATMSRSQG